MSKGDKPFEKLSLPRSLDWVEMGKNRPGKSLLFGLNNLLLSHFNL
jgi:hypothetical protein